ncbi:MAG TPA: lamin tail domain-containing protein, partial [Candidatus Paceibacterota bacterium]|nr:lamin tail domain-containing protein [Candidatus Paceibacterota bacterium]
AVALATIPAPTGIVLGTSTVADTAVTASTTTLVPTNIFPVSSNGIIFGGGSGGPVIAAATDPAPAQESASIIATVDDPATTTDEVPVVTDTSTTDLDNPAAVINEIEWAGDMFDGGREWIELKNRTANDVDLSNYVIYAKDGGSQYIPLVGTLPANGFFVVQRDSRAPFSSASEQIQITPFDQLADSGEQLALARIDDTGTTTVDMTPALDACSGWCAGSASADQGETLSMERISADALGANPSNWASNDTYSVTAAMPTPVGQPWKANGLPLYATPLQENSLHQPDIGFYCNPDKYSITVGQNYHPQTGQCTVLDRNIPFPGPLSAGVFKGVVGSSTQVGSLPGFFHSGKSAAITVDFSDAHDGDQYFVAMWQPIFFAGLIGGGTCTNPNDDIRLPLYFTTGHWLARDGFCGDFTSDMTSVPETPFVLIPFTYTQ